MAEQYLSAHELDDKIMRYCGRRVQVKLKESSSLFPLGDVLTCVAWYYDEHAIDIDDEEEKEFMGYGMRVYDVEINGVPIAGVGSIPFAHIAGFIPLEGENTPEEIDRLFKKASGIKA
ncbi:hypothetical protein [uncultured Fretibacterium sp.]|mgnify:FL=1|uniref:hypothetical protein n=1 Tax=uncultured Fretibacterium sp. TaxID=1678694 RepID=UPI002633C625|nr:hypothetical protein [uncultured Fretibacterium sp.]